MKISNAVHITMDFGKDFRRRSAYLFPVQGQRGTVVKHRLQRAAGGVCSFQNDPQTGLDISLVPAFDAHSVKLYLAAIGTTHNPAAMGSPFQTNFVGVVRAALTNGSGLLVDCGNGTNDENFRFQIYPFNAPDDSTGKPLKR